MLERILANLISNALRYTPVGGRVLVAARQRGSEIQIEVRDNGMGIAPENQAAIFAEFYQVGNQAREQNKGLGLGLSIVDRLARALTVKISLRSQLSEGTTFALRVPASHPGNLNQQEKLPPLVGKVHFIGHSDHLQLCLQLVEGWHYAISRDDSATPARAPRDAILVVDDELAAAVSAEQAVGTPLIVLVRDGQQKLPPGAHALPTPVRPAKLRALLSQLQKTLPKSMP